MLSYALCERLCHRTQMEKIYGKALPALKGDEKRNSMEYVRGFACIKDFEAELCREMFKVAMLK